jgi:hypothetical protein
VTLYRPRTLALLAVPRLGTREQRIRQERSTEVISVPARPIGVRIERNDHNTADSCDLTLDWSEAGVDPRLLDDATVEVHIANADHRGNWTPSPETCRFIGVVKEVNAARSADDAATVELSCVDYTTLFLEAKPFGSLGIPAYSQRLDEAWRTIVSQTPGADVLATRLTLEGLATFPDLGTAVSERFRKLAKVPTEPETDAWAVWQQCVGMLGLISFMHADRCVVTTATNYYSDADPPMLIYGRNLLSWQESRISALSRKGVGITSFDPLTQTTLEALWPPIGDGRVKRKRAKAKKVQSQETVRTNEDRDYFAVPGVTNQELLVEVAKRAWEERSRQELSGRIATHELAVRTESGKRFDLLNIRAGDSIRVQVEPENQQLLSSLATDSERITFLQARGYGREIAGLLVRNMKEFSRLSAKYLVKRAQIDLQDDGDDGSFEIAIEYVNRIEIDGSATA